MNNMGANVVPQQHAAHETAKSDNHKSLSGSQLTMRRFVLGDGPGASGRYDAPFGQILFFLSLGSWMVAYIYLNTRFMWILNSIAPFDRIEWLCLLPLAVREVFYGRHDRRFWYALPFAAGLASICLSIHHMTFFGGIWLVFCARDIPFRKIAMFAFVVMTVSTSLLVACALLGVVPNPPYEVDPNRPVRFALGFVHPNEAPSYSVFIFMLWAYLRGKRFGAVDAVAIAAIEFFLYRYTNSRAAALVVVILVVVVLAFRAMPIEWQESRIFGALLALSVLIMAIVSLTMAMVYSPDIDWMCKLNSALSDRVHLSHAALDDYGTPLFGQIIVPGASSNYDPITGEWVAGNSELVIDNMYIRVLVTCGVVFFVTMVLLCTLSLEVLANKGENHLLIIIGIVALYGLVECHPYFIAHNTFLFLLTLPLDLIKQGQPSICYQ